MLRQRIRFLLENGQDGQAVKVRAWVRSKRESKKFAFVVVNDGSLQSDLQMIIDADRPAFAALGKVQTGASIEATGTLKESPGKGQRWEVHVDDLTVIGEADPETYPLQKKGHSLEFLREIGHLRPRTNTFGAVFRVRNTLSMLVHEFFQSQGFVWAHTPIITASDCEGAGEMFHVTTLDPAKIQGKVDYTKDFFGKRAHLTVSGQLNGEAMALALGDIYTFGPTFRAENSNTTRHLAEFWMVEPEMAFADLKDDMQLAESFLRFVFAKVVERCPEELAFLAKQYENTSVEALAKLAQEPFVRITYTDAVKELGKAPTKFVFPVEWGLDLQTEHERYLTDEIFKRPVIVTDYPKGIKAFYMKLNPDDKTVAAMDVLVPRIGEIIGGSQREDRVELLEMRMKEAGIPLEDLAWYRDLRRFGGVPHAGFGLGLERLVQYVTGMSNIRDVIPFPRAPQSIDF